MLLYFSKICLALFFLCFCFFDQCNLSEEDQQVAVKESEHYKFLDSIAAGHAITTDFSEHFFDKISLLDMQIQMGSTSIKDREKSVLAYQDFLKRDVGNFTNKEKLFLSSILDSALIAISKINPKLIDFDIELIKMHGKHYGDGVYFTRDRGIFIPKNELENFENDKVYAVILHEIFHILSRENKELRNQLYALIGFRPMEKSFVLPEAVSQRLLTNPDGVNIDFFINLKVGEQIKKAAALIVSSEDKFNPNRSSFFEYLKFDLYEVIEKDNQYTLLANDIGFSKLDPLFMESFFSQIKDNTKYIIHPDEIMADNFMLLVLGESRGRMDDFSPSGTQLQLDVKRLLKSVN